MKTLGGKDGNGDGKMGLIVLPPFAGLAGRMGGEVQVLLTKDPGIAAHGIFDKGQLLAYLAELMPEAGIGGATPWRLAIRHSPPVGERVVVKTADGMVTSGKLVSLEEQRWELDEGVFLLTDGTGPHGERKVAAWTPL